MRQHGEKFSPPWPNISAGTAIHLNSLAINLASLANTFGHHGQNLSPGWPQNPDSMCHLSKYLDRLAILAPEVQHLAMFKPHCPNNDIFGQGGHICV
jgi:hypothetical protein